MFTKISREINKNFKQNSQKYVGTKIKEQKLNFEPCKQNFYQYGNVEEL